MSSRYHTKRIFKKRPKQGEKPPVKPNAFKSEAKANTWAKEQNLKEFRVDQITEKKFKIRTVF